MWARIVEFVLSVFLVISTFFYPQKTTLFLISNCLNGFLLCLFALLSYHRRLFRMHLCSLGIAFYLIIQGYLLVPVAYAQSQNNLIIGLILLMLAMIPSRSTTPPKKWDSYVQ